MDKVKITPNVLTREQCAEIIANAKNYERDFLKKTPLDNRNTPIKKRWIKILSKYHLTNRIANVRFHNRP